MQIVRFSVGDRLIMKKKHPCQSDVFTVLRVGSDVRRLELEASIEDISTVISALDP